MDKAVVFGTTDAGSIPAKGTASAKRVGTEGCAPACAGRFDSRRAHTGNTNKIEYQVGAVIPKNEGYEIERLYFPVSDLEGCDKWEKNARKDIQNHLAILTIVTEN